jgi:hypothetical protein
MIERGMNVEKKTTIAELEAKYKALGEEIEIRKKAEAEERNAKLKAEKDSRYNEVIEAYKKFEKLRGQYVDDYGYFTFEITNKNGDSHSWFWNTIGVL